MNDRARLIEDIYSVTDEWEWWPMRIPPFEMFSDCGIDTEDVALLLHELRQRGYVFEVTACPGCVHDVMDLVEGRPFSRLVHDDSHWEFRPFVPLRRTWWQRMVDYFR